MLKKIVDYIIGSKIKILCADWLPNQNQYTGHSLRTTSATLIVDSGVDITTPKRHGGWKSNSATENSFAE